MFEGRRSEGETGRRSWFGGKVWGLQQGRSNESGDPKIIFRELLGEKG